MWQQRSTRGAEAEKHVLLDRPVNPTIVPPPAFSFLSPGLVPVAALAVAVVVVAAAGVVADTVVDVALAVVAVAVAGVVADTVVAVAVAGVVADTVVDVAVSVLAVAVVVVVVDRFYIALFPALSKPHCARM